MVAIAAIFFASTGSALALNNSAFVSQVVPTTMTVGTTYTVSVTLQNNGDTTWTSAAYYRLGSQNPHENMAWGVGRAHLTGSVAPSANVTITFNVVAPNTAGTYNFQWRMLQENGSGWFGALTTNVAVTVTGVSQAQYIYDEIGRLVEVVAPNGASGRYVYDPVGNLLSTTNNPSTVVSIAEFTPNAGPVGQPVTIYGSGYSTTPASNTVKFNATNATVTAATATSLTTTVPAGATTGPISVTNINGTGTSLSNFTVGAITFPAPTITGFTPPSGVGGQAVTISGTGFQTTAINNQVRFGTWAAPVSSANATTIVSTVPAGTASGKITVATPYGTATSATDFYAVPSGHLAADVEARARLTVGGSAATVSTITNGRKILLIFDGTAGQFVSLSLTNRTFASAFMQVTAHAPDGTTLVGMGSGNSNYDRLDIRLPTTGTYTVLIWAAASDKGSVTAQIRPAATGVLTMGSTTTAALTAGQMGVYTLSAAPRSGVQIDVSNVAIPANTKVTLLSYDDIHVLRTATTTSTGVSLAPVELPSIGSVATYKVLVQPDANNSGTLVLRPGAPDLAVSAYTVGAVTVNGDGSYSFPVTFTVTNTGVLLAQAPWYDRCYLSSDTALGATDPVAGATYHGTALAVGAAYSVTMTCTSPTTTPAGTYRAFVKADGNWSGSFDIPGGSVIELSDTNNVSAPLVVILPAKPDLAASNLTIGAVTTNLDRTYSFPVAFTVTNIGTVVAPAPWYDYCYVSSDGILDIWADKWGAWKERTTALAPGASYPVSFTCYTRTTASGVHTVFVKADGSDYAAGGYGYGTLSRVGEVTESNNILSAQVMLPAQPPATLPDLTVSALSVGIITVSANGSHSIPVTFTVNNINPGTAQPSWYNECFLSTDTALDVSDRYVGYNQRTTPLAGNTSYTSTITCTTPAGTTPGTYQLFMKADGYDNGTYYTAQSLLTESNETNNARSVQVVLPAYTPPPPPQPPDLTVSGVTIGTITKFADSSHSFPVTFTVNNITANTAQPYWYDECFLSSDTILDISDRWLLGWNRRDTAMAGNTSYTATIICRTPAATAPGTYRLFMKADAYDNGTYYTAQSLVTESNEANNAVSVQLVLP